MGRCVCYMEKYVKMCKHCLTEEKRRTKLYTDQRKKGGKGDHKGVHWMEAVNQTKELESGETEDLLSGWPWSMAIRLEEGLKLEKKMKMRKKIEQENKFD